MKLRMILLLSAATLLLGANALKYSGIFSRTDAAGPAAELKKISLNYQRPGTKENAQVKNNIFNGEAEDAGTTVQAPPAQKTPTPAPKAWPHFKVTGVAVNEGKKCAFFSGNEFSGAVNEGAEFGESYVLESIKDNKLVISDKATGEKKTYIMEGR